MRFLVITTALFACAAAAPSALLAGHYAHDPLALAHGAHLAVAHAAPYAVAHAPLVAAAPTISPGDLQGAAIDAHVEASDHVRAAVDAAREYHDQASELHGQAANAAEDHSWQALDAVKTAEATLDGQAAGAAPIIAKQLAGHAAYAAPLTYAATAFHAAPALHAAPLYAGHAAYAGPGFATSNSISTQSLSQSHPAPYVHASPVFAHSAPVYAHGASLLAPHGYTHGW